ncbi:MAG: hypothetical protein RLZZ58_1157 [Pseudomonadota bacterium]
MRAHVRRLAQDKSAVAAVEFALAAPLALTLLLGVLQIGLAMQAHNAMRGAAGEIGRYVVVEYMTENELDDGQIEDAAIARATAAPYLLKGNNLDVEATTDAGNTVEGTKKIDLTIDYEVPGILPFAPFNVISMTVEKSIYAYNPD